MNNISNKNLTNVKKSLEVASFNVNNLKKQLKVADNQLVKWISEDMKALDNNFVMQLKVVKL